MRNTTNKNFLQRVLWLEQVLNAAIRPSADELALMHSVRDFCTLEVNKKFEKISYNTLKSAAEQNKTITNNASRLNWSDFKNLLIHATSIAQSHIEALPKIELPPTEAILAKTLLEAHISSIAFIELVNFLENFIKHNPELSTSNRSKIEHQLEISTAKFKSVISSTDRFSSERAALRSVKPSDKK